MSHYLIDVLSSILTALSRQRSLSLKAVLPLFAILSLNVGYSTSTGRSEVAPLPVMGISRTHGNYPTIYAVDHGTTFDLSRSATYSALPTTTQPIITQGPNSGAQHAHVIVKLRNSTAQSLSLAVSSTANTVNISSASAADPVLGAMLAKHAVHVASPLSFRHVHARRQLGRSEAQLSAAMRQRFPARARRAPANETPPDLSSTYVFDLGERSASDVAATVKALRSDPNVLYAEEERVVRVLYTPNDPSYSKTGTWGQTYDDLYGLKKIGTTAAWDTTQGQGVIVAVIDTGVDYNHPDIKDNIWSNPGEISGNGLDDDSNGFIDDVQGWNFVGANSATPVESDDPMDKFGHGTHVAGIIAATGDNNEGVVGVAWKAKIMIVKALDDNGMGTDADLARAIIYAVDNGADVINASWGGQGFSQTETDAINYAHAHGVVFIAAAGNSSSDVSDFSPANVPNAIAVSATDFSDTLAYFSNFGSKVDVAAPGVDILSLEAGTAGYVRKDGTSMAAPHVSGVAALVIAQHPSYSNEQVRQALRISATDLGSLGKDTSFGYGRINAAQAVLLNQVLEAKLSSPIDGIAISNVTTLTGNAAGPGFDHYIVDYGAGAAPGSWVTLNNTTVPVTGGVVGTFDPTTLTDGVYTVRLRAFDTLGAVYSDQIQVHVRYLEIKWPLAPATPSLTQEVMPGATYQITGSATGPSLQSFVLEWAPGTAATTGWSSEGFTLTGNGLSAVTDGVIGTWTPPSILSGYYTIRLTVFNSGFSSTVTSVVYAEPALVSSSWPKYVGPIGYTQSPIPVHQPDGTTRFVLCGNSAPFALYSFAFDGSVETIPLDYGSNYQPAAADLDGHAGDEIVVPDADKLRVLSSSLVQLRTIATDAGHIFGWDQVVLADLDNDGVPEILAPARNTNTSPYTEGALYLYRADGTLFSNIAPPSFSTSWVSSINIAAVDLNGDGRKEIVMAFNNGERTSYTLEAFNADGSPYSGWAPIQFPNTEITSLLVADLDHDGTNELIFTEYNRTTQSDQIRVVNCTGQVRTGWPVLVAGQSYGVAKIAIGDLDRNQHNEIVVDALSAISVLRDDGSQWCQPWSNGGNPPWNSITTPLIADIDGDGIPEILAITTSTNFNNNSLGYNTSSLVRYHRDGTVQQSWSLFGAAGQQPHIGTPLVGDFNNDGKTDIVINTSLIQGGGCSGWLINSALTCLTTGTTFNAAGSDWVTSLHDSQNTGTINSAPVITSQPQSQSAVVGSSITLIAAAGGNPIPTFQWRKNGEDIFGATSSVLNLANVHMADAGNYTAVATNIVGSTTSDPATLTVPNSPPTIGTIATQAIITGSNTGALTLSFADAETNSSSLTVTGASSNTTLVPNENIVFGSDGANYTVTVTPVANQTGTTFITLMVSDGELTTVTMFTVTVLPISALPAITSSNSTTFTVGLPCSFTIKATGDPAPIFSISGQPAWVSMNASTGVLSGTAPAETAGTQFTFTLTAKNGFVPDATQIFTLKVQPVPLVTEPLIVTTLAGHAGLSGSTNDTGAAARFYSPIAAATDNSGNFYIADLDNNVIRKVTSAGAVTTLAGQVGVAGNIDGTGTAASFNSPSGLTIDSAGNLYVADSLNHTIRRIITSTGAVTTLAGQAGAPGSADGVGTSARFYGPEGLAVDAEGMLYVADTINHTIRKIVLATAEVTTIAGQVGVEGNADGAGTAATFKSPCGIAVGANNTLYIADSENNTVRKIAANSAVTTLAGVAGSTGASDGTGNEARFNDPSALAADSTGANLYVLDTANHTMRKIVTATGVVTTLAGSAGKLGSADGIGETARFNFPSGIGSVASGLGIADTANHTVRLGLFSAPIVITTQPQNQTVTAGTNVNFSVTATGLPVPTYQWYFNNAAIAGATGSSCSITNAQATNSGSYSVVVSNALNSVTSNTGTLTVNPVPSSSSSSSSGSGSGGGAPYASFWLTLALVVVVRGIAIWRDRFAA